MKEEEEEEIEVKRGTSIPKRGKKVKTSARGVNFSVLRDQKLFWKRGAMVLGP
jgi:hypothetical protein